MGMTDSPLMMALLWLLRLGSKLLLGNCLLEMCWESINLTITIFISGESFKSNLFLSQLGEWCKSRLLWLRGKLLLLLGGKLLLLSKSRLLLLLSLGKPLVLGKLGIKLARLLLLLLLSKSRLLLSWGKLLLGLLGKLLLGLLLSLLKLLEILVKVLCVELF